MQRIFVKVLFAVLLWITHSSFAQASPFFTVTVQGSTLSIKTTVFKHVYSSAGIKVNKPGHALANPTTDCTFIPNGYCLFIASDLSQHDIVINGPPGNVSVTLCLDGESASSCQKYDVTIV